MRNGQSIMLDNGTFGAWRKGIELDFTKYYAWVEPHLAHPHWAVIPDVIEGEIADNDALLAQWPYPPALSCAVWHMHEPLDRLVALAGAWPRIAIGSSGQYDQPGTTIWKLRIDAAWERLRALRLFPHVHMMRAMKEASEGLWEFGSADSATAARNHNAIPSRDMPAKDVVEIVNRLNSRNPLRGMPAYRGAFFPVED